MKLPFLLATVAVIAAPSPSTSGPSPDVAGVAAPGLAPTAPARLPAFAATLAQQPDVVSPDAWVVLPDRRGAWQRLATAPRGALQQARWDYARSLIGQGRGAEAFAVLEVMRQDDPDLAMVDAYRLALGVAQALMGRPADTFTTLSVPSLLTNAEACAWRLRALAETSYAEEAVQQIKCALPALNARHGANRLPFLLAAARAAVESGRPNYAFGLLADVSDRHAGANLYRGRAELALGRGEEARLRFARVEQSGTIAQRMDARLSQIEAQVASAAITRPVALKQLDALRFVWRGDQVEERALRLSYRLSDEAGDVRGAIAVGSVLFRFFDPVRQGPDFVSGLQDRLARALDPASGLPLDQAAGLYWDYRDLAPAGAEGDRLVFSLADRLQTAGLYPRAADLLEHQLFFRAQDVAQGPLSVRVATLHILAGHPDRAVKAMRESADNPYPLAMLHARQRVEAVALGQLGRSKEALAILQEVPGSGPLRAEIVWRNRDWNALVQEAGPELPRPSADLLSDVGQASVLRYAIALAMLGREDDLAALRVRYVGSFQGLPSAPVFDLLTARVGNVDSENLARAMAAIPSASGAGDMADLLDAPAAPSRRGV
jgi:tetratricopeptide (TPR) repeat protein